MPPELPMTDPVQYASDPEDPPAVEEPVKYGRGKNPNSAKNLQPRKKREPDEPKVTYMKPVKKAETVVWDTAEPKPESKKKSKKKIVVVEQDSESDSDDAEDYRVVVARRPRKRSTSAPPNPKKSVTFKPDPLESISDEDSSTFERQSKSRLPPTPARPVLTFI